MSDTKSDKIGPASGVEHAPTEYASLSRRCRPSNCSLIADAMFAALQAPAECKPVAAGGAARAARMLGDLI